MSKEISGTEDFAEVLLRRGTPRANRWLAFGFALVVFVPLLVGLALDTWLPRSFPKVGGAWVTVAAMVSVAAGAVFFLAAYYRRGLRVSWAGWVWVTAAIAWAGSRVAGMLGTPVSEQVENAVLLLLLLTALSWWWQSYYQARRQGQPTMRVGWLVMNSVLLVACWVSIFLDMTNLITSGWSVAWAIMVLMLVMMVGREVLQRLWLRRAPLPPPPPPRPRPQTWRPGPGRD